MQFFQTEKRDVVLRRVDDGPLMLLNVKVKCCCPLVPGINMTLARSDTRAIRQELRHSPNGIKCAQISLNLGRLIVSYGICLQFLSHLCEGVVC